MTGKSCRTACPPYPRARFIRLTNQPEIAEFAVTVVDRYQHRGIGSLLMAVLYGMARLEGVQTLRGFVLPENQLMADWLSRLGAVCHYENDIYRMDLTVHGNSQDLPIPRLQKIFGDYADKITPIATQMPE